MALANTMESVLFVGAIEPRYMAQLTRREDHRRNRTIDGNARTRRPGTEMDYQN